MPRSSPNWVVRAFQMTGALGQDFEHRALMGASATMTMMALQELCIFDNENEMTCFAVQGFH